MLLRCYYYAVSMLWMDRMPTMRKYDATAMLLRCHYDATRCHDAMKLVYFQSFANTMLRCYCYATTMLLRCYYYAVRMLWMDRMLLATV